jgi:simple sugar transport system permease protein
MSAADPIAPPRRRRLPHGLGVAAWSGVVLGLVGAWLTLPPLTARSWGWSLAVCLVAVTLGVGVVLRGERRRGGLAIASGVLGFALAYAATLSSVGRLEAVVAWSALFAAMLRYATPLLFAALGGLFAERSGVVNIGLEGMMLVGAFFAFLGAERSGSWVVGLLAGLLAGGAAGLLHAVWCVSFGADQIVAGTAVNILALGLTGYLYVDVYGLQGAPTDVPGIPNVDLGALGGVPLLGSVVDDLNLMVWTALALVAVSWLVLFRTPAGLRLRSVGEHPRAADAVGIDVYAVRYGAVIVSGMLAAAGGAYLSIGFVNSFNENMTAGRGFIALAALIFGAWRPFGAAAACLLFGFASALGQRLPEYSQSASVLFQALPYVLTLIAVAGVIGRSIPPAAVGRPYTKQ